MPDTPWLDFAVDWWETWFMAFVIGAALGAILYSLLMARSLPW